VQFKPTASSWISPHHHTAGRHQPESGAGVSSLDFTNSVTLQASHPSLAQRRAETEVLLKDGESSQLRLIDQQVIETMIRCRAWRYPILGKLFRSRSTHKSNDELLVLITRTSCARSAPKRRLSCRICPRPSSPRCPIGRPSVERQGHDAGRTRQPAGVCRSPWPADTPAVEACGAAL